MQNPSLFGIKYSNRDFSRKECWGKNCFNSSFPAALCAYLDAKNIQNVYIKLDSNLEVTHSHISTAEFYGIDPNSDNIFYAFESPFTPYNRYLLGDLPRVDLVIQARDTGSCLQAIEIKLTALPDNTTCNYMEDNYGCELVIRPDTIVYLACSIADTLKLRPSLIGDLIGKKFVQISDWTEPSYVIPYIQLMINIINSISLSILNEQKPFLMQPVWKTKGKSPKLAESCLDVFVWSDLAFARLFIDLARKNKIDRPTRTVVWLFKMIHDFSLNNCFDHKKIIDNLSYNTKNDKAFSAPGSFTHNYMKSEFLRKPRIKKQEIKEIILGGGQNLLSPERRFDAIIYNDPDLFDLSN